jgi:hypothetical protein
MYNGFCFGKATPPFLLRLVPREVVCVYFEECQLDQGMSRVQAKPAAFAAGFLFIHLTGQLPSHVCPINN